MGLKKRICEECGKTFETDDILQFYCSETCEHKKNTKNIFEKTCVVCGKVFTAKAHNRRFCSEDCKSKHRLEVERARVGQKVTRYNIELSNMNKVAVESGMSYGKYASQFYAPRIQRREK